MTQARKAESMASLRSQLPDLEAIEPISQVKHAFELKIPSRDPRLRDSVNLICLPGGAPAIPAGPALKLVKFMWR